MKAGRIKGASLADLLLILALIPLLVVSCIGSTCRSRETANRVKCARWSAPQRRDGRAFPAHAHPGHHVRYLHQDGQNVLYGDGRVEWQQNPFVGVNRDNIYTTRDGRIVASPVDANDSILLPTAE